MSNPEISEADCKSTQPLKEWIHGPNQKLCRPCALPILAGWYRNELEESGQADMANEIVGLSGKEDVTPDELAEKLDGLKERVQDEKLKSRLKEFDCVIQVNESQIS